METGISDLALRNAKEIGRAHMRCLALDADLVGLWHVLIEDLARDRNEPRVSDPRPVMACVHLAQFVLPDLIQRASVGVGIALDRDLGRHPAHGVNAAAMAN